MGANAKSSRIRLPTATVASSLSATSTRTVITIITAQPPAKHQKNNFSLIQRMCLPIVQLADTSRLHVCLCDTCLCVFVGVHARVCVCLCACIRACLNAFTLILLKFCSFSSGGLISPQRSGRRERSTSKVVRPL